MRGEVPSRGAAWRPRKGVSRVLVSLAPFRSKGHVDLPNTLKSLFRPVAMVVPHYHMIAEISLLAVGFQFAKPLSRKLVNLYELASKQLSQQVRDARTPHAKVLMQS